MNRRKRKTCVLLVLIAAAIVNAGCDGGIGINGRVYTQQSQSGPSRIFVDEIPDEDLSGLVPLADATVTAYYGGDYANVPIDTSTPWKDSVPTDDTGVFSVGGTCAPSKFHAALVVEKPGFQSVTKAFLHDKFNHQVIVILAPITTVNSSSSSGTRPN